MAPVCLLLFFKEAQAQFQTCAETWPSWTSWHPSLKVRPFAREGSLLTSRLWHKCIFRNYQTAHVAHVYVHACHDSDDVAVRKF